MLDLVRQGTAEFGIAWVKPPDAVRFYNVGAPDLVAAFPPGTKLERDAVLTDRLAEVLGLQVGDSVRVERRESDREATSLQVSALVAEPLDAST